MYVCLSGLQLKYTDLCIVYVLFCHVPLMVPSLDEGLGADGGQKTTAG